LRTNHPEGTHTMHAVLLPTFVILLALPSASLAANQRTISVSGTAISRVVPDTVVWKVSVTARHANLTKAKGKSDAQITGILSTAKKLGATEPNVQTGYINVDKEYQRGPHGQRGAFKRFTITRVVTIKVMDTARFDDYLGALVRNTDMTVSYQLETSKAVDIRSETRLRAVTSARKKAAAMAKALGAKIGVPLTINEGAGSPPPHGYANNDAFTGRLDAARGDSSTFAAGSVPIRVTVGVVFALQ
jgi:uncharacterized protein YggE